MAQQDLSSKVLESHNEIFANIFNTFVFNGKQILEPEYLQDEPTENIFLDNDGDYRNNLRDIFKSYKVKGIGAPVRLAYLGIENQSNIDNDMDYLRYPIDVLMALYAYTNDVRYLAMKNNILQKLSKGGNVTMPELLDKIEYDGAVKIAKKLISMGKLSLEDIVEGTSLPLEVVQELAKQTAA